MLVYILKFYVPEFIKKQKLNELFRLTAHAFHCNPIDITALSYEEGLAEYALATKKQAEIYLSSGRSIKQLKRRLFKNAYNWGQSLRKMLGIKTWKQANVALKELYKLIGIELFYSKQGKILIKQCYFSGYYSPDICKLFSALDAGLAAGLSEGGRFRFQQRITEGNTCCKGIFERCLNEKGDCSRKRRRGRNGSKGAARQI